MTGAELLSNLAIRVEDTSHVDFTEAVKLEALNIAQRKAMGIMSNDYLSLTHTVVRTDIATAASARFDDSWYIELNTTTLGSEILKDGPNVLKVWDNITSKWCRWLSLDETDMYYTNSYLSVTEHSEPVAWIVRNILYIRAASQPTIDVYFIKEPTDIANDSTECALDKVFQEPVLDLAEAQLWRIDNKAARSQAAETSGFQLLNALNLRSADEIKVSKERNI